MHIILASEVSSVFQFLYWFWDDKTVANRQPHCCIYGAISHLAVADVEEVGCCYIEEKKLIGI